MSLVSPLVAPARRALRAAYAEERLGPRVRWTLVAAGMRDFLRILARKLRTRMGESARPTVAELFGRTLERRYAALHPMAGLPERGVAPRALPSLFAALYQLPVEPRMRWILDAVGGAPRGPREWLRAAELARALDAEARWSELTVHLGELLIVITDELPARLPRARQIVAEMCHDMGSRYARRMIPLLGLESGAPVASAIEILRTSEYVFRVNPEHVSGADESARAGFIDGDACPWFERPGWGPVHCGIFGQFQAGVCGELGLGYRLTQTIPKHGGDRCRVDLVPLRRAR